MQLKRVIITGIGTINPLRNNISEYFNNLDNGKSGASLITRFDASLFKTNFACEIKDYDRNLIWFARTIDGGWFSMDVDKAWQGGRLDIDGKLEDYLVSLFD